jgi:precorrin-2/cobalt-factor-2 C20-methyltransferase
MKLGRLYGIGVGPGDPGLLTVKAVKLITDTPVLCAPRAGDGSESFALSIVREYVNPERQKIITPLFPMSMDKAVLENAWSEAADQVAEELGKGNDVAFLTLGDPSIYSTFSYVKARVKERLPALTSETVPGVSSMTLAAARAGMDLALGQERLAVMPVGRDMEKVRKALIDFDCVVLMKVNRGLGRLVELLEETGMLKDAVYVSRCGTDRELIIRDLKSIREEDQDYFSLVIVRKECPKFIS